MILQIQLVRLNFRILLVVLTEKHRVVFSRTRLFRRTSQSIEIMIVIFFN